MGVSEDVYENTDAITVDWDFQFHALEQRREAVAREKANRPS